MFVFQAAALGPQFKNVQGGCIINKQRRLCEALNTFRIQLLHFMLFHFTPADFFKPYFTFGRENPLYQLTGTHLKGEQGHTGLFTRMHHRITGQVQGECCFTHGRTGSEDDQVGCLPAIRYTIQRRETAGYTCYIFIFMTKIFDPLDGIYQYGVNRFKVLTQVIIGNLK